MEHYPATCAAALVPVIPLVERLKQVANLWAIATGRSLGALGTIVANHGSFFERLEAPGAGTTTASLEKFALFLVEPANWPGEQVPEEVCAFAHAVGVNAGACALSPDIAAERIGTSVGDRTNDRPAASMPPATVPEAPAHDPAGDASGRTPPPCEGVGASAAPVPAASPPIPNGAGAADEQIPDVAA